MTETGHFYATKDNLPTSYCVHTTQWNCVHTMDKVYWPKLVKATQKEAVEKAFVGLIENNYKQGVPTELSIFQCSQWFSRANQTPRIRAIPTLHQNTRVLVLANISFCCCSLLNWCCGLSQRYGVSLWDAVSLSYGISLFCGVSPCITWCWTHCTGCIRLHESHEAMKDGVYKKMGREEGCYWCTMEVGDFIN